MSASSKDTFEPQSFWAHTFKCGAFRGIAVSAAVGGPFVIEQDHIHVPGEEQAVIHIPGEEEAVLI